MEEEYSLSSDIFSSDEESDDSQKIKYDYISDSDSLESESHFRLGPIKKLENSSINSVNGLNSKISNTRSELFSKLKWYCFMMVNWSAEQKINTWIEESIQPLLSLELHNGKKAFNSKYTQSAAGSWKIELIIGSFDNIDEAHRFVLDWKDQCRGVPSRRQKGIHLAQINKLICWDRRANEKTN